MTNEIIQPLSKQLLIKGFGPILLLLLAMTLLQYQVFSNQAFEKSENRLQLLSTSLAKIIHQQNQQAMNVAKSLASSQVHGLFGQRAQSSSLIKEMVHNSPDFIGISICYEPNADQNDLSFLNNSNDPTLIAGMDKGGRFLPYWFRREEDRNKLNIRHSISPDTRLYYQGPKTAFLNEGTRTGFITEPYNTHADESEGEFILEYVYPIIIQDEFKGIVSVDKALLDIGKLMRNELTNHQAEAYLISRDGRFVSITSPQQKSLLSKRIIDTQFADIFNVQSNSDEKPFQYVTYPDSNQEYLIASQNISGADWTLVVSKSKASILSSVYASLGILLAIAISILLLASLFVRWSLNATTGRVTKVVSAADQLSKGSLPDLRQIDDKHKDEVAALSKAFNAVISYYDDAKKACNEIAEGNFDVRMEPRSEDDVLANAINFLASKREAAEQKMIEAQVLAEEANEAKSTFLANMSHEIRTPMNAVLGLSRLCLATELSPQQRGYIDNIHTSGQGLLNIINEILDFSKIEAGKLTLENCVFSFDSVFRYVANISQQSASEKGLELVFDIESPSREVMGDSSRLTQVLVNLVGNAIKFTNEGEVIVKLRWLEHNKNQHKMLISVIDSGIGISSKKQKYLFESFSQAERSTTRKYGGTGLGLAISKNLVELMGGEISIQSEYGKGTIVEVSLSLDEAEHTADDSCELSKMEESNDIEVNTILDGKTALLIEPHIPSKEAIRRILVEKGLSVMEVDDTEVALKTLLRNASKTIDVVIVDSNIHALAGVENSDIIYQQFAKQTTPMVLLQRELFNDEVDWSDSTSATEQNNLHHTEVLAKPIFEKELCRAVASSLGWISEATNGDKKWALGANLDFTGNHVLVADDNVVNQQIAAELLKSVSISYDLALNGKQAIDMLLKDHFDAVLIDIQMPIMGGIEATEIIRNNPNFRTLPIIAMTANSMPTHKQACLEAGMNAHISKPIDPDDFYEVLSQFLQPASNEQKSDKANTVADSSACSTQLPELETRSIDVEAGIQAMGNSVKKYQEICQVFERSHCNDISALRNIVEQPALSDGDIAKTIGIVHSIAGVAKFIGASLLAESAHKLEVGIEHLSNEEAYQHIHMIIEELQSVFKDLAMIATVAIAEESESHSINQNLNAIKAMPLKENMEGLIDATINMNANAIEFALGLEYKLRDTSSVELISLLISQLRNYQFGEASNTLAKIAINTDMEIDGKGTAFQVNKTKNKTHIMVVDDDLTNHRVLLSLLEQTYRVSLAKNGEKAIKQIDKLLPDLVLLDIDMPGINGYEVCQALKANQRTKDIPVIFISRMVDSDTEQKCFEMGGVDYIAKPFVAAVVLARIQTHIALKSKNEELKIKGLTDETTGVANRRGFNIKLSEEVARANRDKTPLSLLMIDIDKFKLFNDTYGHASGDECLQKVANLMSLSLRRPGDYFARYGGEEFAAILPNTNQEGASAVANKMVRCAVSLNIEHEQSSFKKVTTSVGAITFLASSGKSIDSDQMIQRADAMLYAAKERGGNQQASDTFV